MALELELPTEMGVGIGTADVRRITSEYIESSDFFKSVIEESSGLDGPFVAGVVDVGSLSTKSVVIYFDFVVDGHLSKVIISDDSADANVDSELVEEVQEIKEKASDELLTEIEEAAK